MSKIEETTTLIPENHWQQAFDASIALGWLSMACMDLKYEGVTASDAEAAAYERLAGALSDTAIAVSRKIPRSAFSELEEKRRQEAVVEVVPTEDLEPISPDQIMQLPIPEVVGNSPLYASWTLKTLLAFKDRPVSNINIAKVLYAGEFEKTKDKRMMVATAAQVMNSVSVFKGIYPDKRIERAYLVQPNNRRRLFFVIKDEQAAFESNDVEIGQQPSDTELRELAIRLRLEEQQYQLDNPPQESLDNGSRVKEFKIITIKHETVPPKLMFKSDAARALFSMLKAVPTDHIPSWDQQYVIKDEKMLDDLARRNIINEVQRRQGTMDRPAIVAAMLLKSEKDRGLLEPEGSDEGMDIIVKIEKEFLAAFTDKRKFAEVLKRIEEGNNGIRHDN